MKIGVISDTHGSVYYFDKAMEVLNDCEVIIHAGDILNHGPRNIIPKGYEPKELFEKLNQTKNLIIAKGNCDSDVDQMVIDHPIQNSYVFSQFENKRIITTHGYIDSKEEMIKRAKSLRGDILIFGHTHVKELYFDDNLIVLNPGSTTIPKDKSHSVSIIEIENDSIKIDLIDILNKEIINSL